MGKGKRLFESVSEIKLLTAKAYRYQQIFLPKDEYAKVMSELNTHLSDKERNCRLVTRAIGDYYYTVINRGFDDYTIIDKSPIYEDSIEEWERDNGDNC